MYDKVVKVRGSFEWFLKVVFKVTTVTTALNDEEQRLMQQTVLRYCRESDRTSALMSYRQTIDSFIATIND